MIKITFENCLQLLLESNDQSLEPEDIPLLQAKFKDWQKQFSVTFFQPESNIKIDLPLLGEFSANSATPTNLAEINKTIKRGYVVIYFARNVEQEIDCVWQQSPSRAWLLAGLAQAICRTAATKILGVQACLPLPIIDDKLAQFMNKYKMLRAGSLNYKFALFSFYPAKKSCFFCSLKASCPKI